ncbi:MAG: signal peptidase II [Parcubacteria group bacterium]|nr:signal peptidase II [Parcubacteria group bacterium]
MRNRTLIPALALFGFVIDRILKQYALEAPPLARGVFAVGNDLGMRIHVNEFFAWSVPIPNSVVLWIMIVVIAALAWALYKKRARAEWMFLSLVLAGAVSNAIDRLLYGGVIDYIVVPYGGVFNLADALVVFGITLLAFPRKRYAH